MRCRRILVVAVLLALLLFRGGPRFGLGDDSTRRLDPLRPRVPNEVYGKEFPVNGNGDVLVLPAKSGNHNLRLIVNTSCQLLAYYPPAHPLLGRHFEDRTRSTPSYANETLSIHFAPPIQVGGLSLREETLAFALRGAEYDLFKSYGYCEDGMLGMDTLRHMIMQVDFDRGMLKWLREFTPTTEIVLRLRNSPPEIFPEVFVWFPGIGVERFLIDTSYVATSGAVIEHELFQRLERAGWLSVLDERFPAPNNDGSDAIYYRAGFLQREAFIDSIPLPECLFSESIEGGRSVLGLAFLSRFNVTFDFPKGMLYLQPRKNMNRPDRTNLSGLSITKPDGAAIAHFVVPDSAAYKAGVISKDVLVRIRQKDATKLSWYEIESELSTPGGEVPLTVRRGPRMLDLKLVLPTITPPKRIAVDTSKSKFLPDDD